MPGTRRVLVVDDSGDIRDMLTFSLENQGCEVRTAASRDEALLLLESGWLPQVILLDYCMAGMGPKEFIARVVRMNQKLPRIIVMTAATEADDRANSLGVPELLRKPFNPADLFSKIEGCAV